MAGRMFSGRMRDLEVASSFPSLALDDGRHVITWWCIIRNNGGWPSRCPWCIIPCHLFGSEDLQNKIVHLINAI